MILEKAYFLQKSIYFAYTNMVYTMGEIMFRVLDSYLQPYDDRQSNI